VTSVTFNSGTTYTISGTQLSGLINGSDEGDDMTNQQNYPIVWLKNSAGNVYYCRSFNFSSMVPSKGSAIETVAADTTMFDAVRVLGEKRIGALPVLEGGQIAGIIPERDVIYCLREHGADVLAWPVSRVMSSPAITTDSQTDVLAALALMTQRRIRHLPVVDGGTIRGIVSIGDLVKHRMERIEAEAEAMRAYIQSA
jgi:CBS domain-containing protein